VLYVVVGLGVSLKRKGTEPESVSEYLARLGIKIPPDIASKWDESEAYINDLGNIVFELADVELEGWMERFYKTPSLDDEIKNFIAYEFFDGYGRYDILFCEPWRECTIFERGHGLLGAEYSFEVWDETTNKLVFVGYIKGDLEITHVERPKEEVEEEWLDAFSHHYAVFYPDYLVLIPVPNRRS